MDLRGSRSPSAMVAEYYYETLPAVKKALPTLEAAYCMNQVARSSDAPPPDPVALNALDGNIDPPAVGGMHTDASEASGFSTVQNVFQMMADDERIALTGNRYELYYLNLWRNVDPLHPIRNYHLALLDRSSLSRDDVRISELEFDGE